MCFQESLLWKPQLQGQPACLPQHRDGAHRDLSPGFSYEVAFNKNNNLRYKDPVTTPKTE